MNPGPAALDIAAATADARTVVARARPPKIRAALRLESMLLVVAVSSLVVGIGCWAVGQAGAASAV